MTHTVKRRGRGEGSIYQRGDGYWVGQVDAGYHPTTGRRRYKRVVRRKRTDALAALKDLQRQVDDGGTPDRTSTVASYLHWWLDEVVGPTVAARSRKEYRNRIERMTPHVGRVKLHKLTKAHVQQLANQLTENYPRSSVASTTLGTLRSALRWAVQAGEISRNPAEGIRVGQAPPRPDETLTADEARAVVAAAEGTEEHALVYLAVHYGLRLGELLDLRWSDVDLAARELTVDQSKTRAGERTLPLTDEAAAVLRSHRSRSTVVALDGRLFGRPTGGRRRPGDVGQVWSDLLRQVGVAHVCRNCGHSQPCSSAVRRFHSARHTAGTLLLEEGVDLEVVSAILGHANIHVTSQIYARVRADLKRRGLGKVTTTAGSTTYAHVITPLFAYSRPQAVSSVPVDNPRRGQPPGATSPNDQGSPVAMATTPDRSTNLATTPC